MNFLRTMILIGYSAFGGAVAFAQFPQSNGQNTASGSISGAHDNPPLRTDDLSVPGHYNNGLSGDNIHGSWSVETGGDFAYRGVAVSSTTNVASFNEDASIYGRGYISYTSYDVLTFDATVPFTLTYRLLGSTSVTHSGDTQAGAGSPLARYNSVTSVKDPDVEPDTFNHIYGGTTVGSMSIQANGINVVDADSETFTATINPGQGLIFYQAATLDIAHTASADGFGLSGESGEMSGSVSGGIDLLSFKIGGVETDEIMVLSQSGEDYFVPVPEPSSTAFLIASAAAVVSLVRRRRK